MASRRRTGAAPSKQLAGSVINPEGIKRRVIVVGASAGGIQVLIRLFSELPPRLGAMVAVVIHRGPVPSALLHVMARKSVLPVVEPDRDVRMKRGTIYLAPPDHHLELEPGWVLVRRGPKEHSTRPAVDPLFRTAAASFGSEVVALLLSGGGDDGVNGMMRVKENGGISLVQDPADAEMPFMPMNAICYDHVDGVLQIEALAPALTALAAGKSVAC